jgi:hypothetical protein
MDGDAAAPVAAHAVTHAIKDLLRVLIAPTFPLPPPARMSGRRSNDAVLRYP